MKTISRIDRTGLLGISSIAVIAALGIGASSPALAQTSGQQSDQTLGATASEQGIGTIIVTARKREETLVDVPLSIQAFSAEDIERRGLDSLQDLVIFTPGMNFQNMGNSQPGRYNTGIRFRGLEGSASSPSNQTGALFVDGVFILAGAGSIPFNDVAQVEVIKGPQAAYFGRGTFGGAVNYITADPGDEFSGRVTAQYSPSYGSNAFSATIDGPISDSLSGRLTVATNSKGSMFTSTDGGELGAERTDTITGTLLFKPTSNLRIKARAQFGEDDDGPAATTFVPYRFFGNCLIGTPVTINTTAGSFSTTLRQRYNCGAVPVIPVSNNTSFYSINVPTTVDPSGVLNIRDVVLGDFLGLPDPGTPDIDGFGLRTNFQVHSLVADWSLTDAFSLSLTGGYNRRSTSAVRDLDGYDSPGWVSRGFLTLKSHSVEMRANYDAGGRWRAMLGGNYYKQTQEGDIDGGFGVFTNLFGGPDIGPGGSVDNNRIKTLGLFGSVEFDILDNLTLSLEARQQRDELIGISGRYGTTLTVAPKEVYESFLPRVLLSFNPWQNTNLYVSYSEGTQPGIVVNAVAALSPAELAAARAIFPNLASSVDAEQLDAWEIGWKQEFSSRAWLSIAAYDMKWTNAKGFAQVNFRSPDTNQFKTFSAFIPGIAKVRGIEAEAHWNATDNLEFHATYGFIDAKYTDFPSSGLNALFGIPTGTSFQAAGNQLPRNPKHAGSLSATWRDDLNEEWSWYLRGDAAYFGKAFTDETNLAWIDSYETLNFRLGFVKESGLTIEIFCTNCADKKGWQTGRRLIDFGDTSPAPNFFTNQGAVVQPLDRLEIGMRAIFDF